MMLRSNLMARPRLTSRKRADLLVRGEALKTRPGEIPAMYAGALGYRPLSDGRCLVAYRMVPGQARICIGEDCAPTYDDYWCFHNAGAALEILASWDGEGPCPGPWHRHGPDQRRELAPDGTVVREWTER